RRGQRHLTVGGSATAVLLVDELVGEANCAAGERGYARANRVLPPRGIRDDRCDGLVGRACSICVESGPDSDATPDCEFATGSIAVSIDVVLWKGLFRRHLVVNVESIEQTPIRELIIRKQQKAIDRPNGESANELVGQGQCSRCGLWPERLTPAELRRY